MSIVERYRKFLNLAPGAYGTVAAILTLAEMLEEQIKLTRKAHALRKIHDGGGQLSDYERAARAEMEGTE